MSGAQMAELVGRRRGERRADPRDVADLRQRATAFGDCPLAWTLLEQAARLEIEILRRRVAEEGGPQ